MVGNVTFGWVVPKSERAASFEVSGGRSSPAVDHTVRSQPLLIVQQRPPEVKVECLHHPPALVGEMYPVCWGSVD